MSATPEARLAEEFRAELERLGAPPELVAAFFENFGEQALYHEFTDARYFGDPEGHARVETGQAGTEQGSAPAANPDTRRYKIPLESGGFFEFLLSGGPVVFDENDTTIFAAALANLRRARWNDVEEAREGRADAGRLRALANRDASRERLRRLAEWAAKSPKLTGGQLYARLGSMSSEERRELLGSDDVPSPRTVQRARNLRDK